MLLAITEQRLGLADKLARVFPDRRNPTRVVHNLTTPARKIDEVPTISACDGYGAAQSELIGKTVVLTDGKAAMWKGAAVYERPVA